MVGVVLVQWLLRMLSERDFSINGIRNKLPFNPDYNKANKPDVITSGLFALLTDSECRIKNYPYMHFLIIP
jgi:hypothetical protein